MLVFFNTSTSKEVSTLTIGLANNWPLFPSYSFLMFKSAQNAVKYERGKLKVYQNIAVWLRRQCTDITHVTVYVFVW
jgi:hypothetical protein